MSKKQEYLDYSINLNPLYDVKRLIGLICANPEFILEYPDHTQTDLALSLSKELDIPPKSIYVGAGATEILFTLPRVISKTRAIIPSPTFWEYSVANSQNGIESHALHLSQHNKFAIDLNELSLLIGKNTVVYICNPNNPTSQLISYEELSSFIIAHPETDFMVDETYLLFRSDYELQSLRKLSVQQDNLYLVTSLSKFFRIPGLRAGLLTAHPRNIQRFKQQAIPYLRSPLVDTLVPHLLSDHNYNQQIRLMLDDLINNFFSTLRIELAGLAKVYPPSTVFALLEILTNTDDKTLISKLENRGIRIRGGSEFKELGGKWIRVAIRTEEENRLLLEALKSILTQEPN